MILGRTRGWIGIDVGSHAVKLAQLERHRGQLRLAAAFVVPRVRAWQAGSSARGRPGESADEICGALALGREFRGRRAACSLPLHLFDFEPLAISEGSEYERRQRIVQQLSREQGELFDFWETEVTDSRGVTSAENVMAVSLPRPWADQVAQDARRARLRCEVLDAMPLALARAVSLMGTRELVACIDWGYTTATLCIMRHSQALFVRQLRDCGLLHCIQPVCAALEVAPEEAQLLLRRHGIPRAGASAADDVQSVLNDILSPPLTRLVDELRRTTAYLKLHRSPLFPPRIVVVGGGATIRHVDRWLEHKLEVPVEIWSPKEVELPAELDEATVPLLGPALALSALAWSQP